MTLLRQIGSVWSCGLILLMAVGSVTTSKAQELVFYPFDRSVLAAEADTQMFTVNTLNNNPLLEDYDVKFYGLNVEVDNRSDEIHGDVTILVETLRNSFGTLAVELYHTLATDSILLDGEPMSFTHTGDELYIDLPTPRDSGTLLSAQIFYGGETGEGMVQETDEEWGVQVTYTSSEPFYSMDWFPCKQNLTDKADSVHLNITTDYSLMGVSNGIHSGTTYFPNGKVRYEWKSNYPIDYYLISIAVADYMEYNLEVQPEGVSQPIFIQNFLYDTPNCLDTYREQINVTIPIMEVFCDLFGPYPFRDEKYGHYLWPRGGGMEHQTLTGMGNFEFYLVAHELGHSWFGNYVTCATWQDIWINEGFATFAGYMATELLAPEYADGEREYRFGRALLEPQGSVYVPEEDADNPARIFSGNLSYNKGMALLYMIRFELQNDDLLFHTLRTFIDLYANDVATGLDFKEVLEETTGRDFTDFFNQWYFGEGYPTYEVTWSQAGGTLTLHSTQSASSATTPLFKMSMEYRIVHAKGDTLVRVFQEANEEVYQFHVPYDVLTIEVDPYNQVLDGETTVKKGTGETEDDPLFSIAPNPIRGDLFFRVMAEEGGEVIEQVDVEILDLAGQLLDRSRFRGCLPYLDYIVRLKDPVSGVYFVRFRYGNRIEVQKVVVE